MVAIIKEKLGKHLGVNVLDILPVHGGDISKAYLVKTQTENFFIKVNNLPEARDMFEKEVIGIQEIASSKAIRTPKIYGILSFNSHEVLVMEYIESKRPTPQQMSDFGISLRKMHSFNNEKFGFKSNNYIGSLIQKNTAHNDWSIFYTDERIISQLKLAKDKNLLGADSIPKRNTMIGTIKGLCEDIKPGLVHGDLWSGNFLFDSRGNVVLIDPAVYYGHGEVDIAMSMLFGGFSKSFYDAYFGNEKAYQNFLRRKDLYQLYYLLVHLNLFGSSYKQPVIKILKHLFFKN